ncbi:uncharacterized protein LOC116951449 [Petromyzon marinus]|uniref:Nuclear mitotic apparatus protein 1-like n=1 Tax=Petromyzon marinus TaxID=7757 RepID=A0AAJ7TXJ4_PETMA|nr:nuclear mitotic apparatus protein 1-like [Petromyzon marinus]
MSGSKAAKTQATKVNLAPTFSKVAADSLAGIETEYIGNLQEQVYLLEMETDFLREQAKKASELQPKMTSEAERMLHKMRGMEVEAQGIHLELRRMEASVSSLRSENELLSRQLRAEQDARADDKRALLAELVAERQRRELGDREATFKEAEVSRARQEQEAALASLRSAEHSVRMLETQLAQRGEQQRATEAELSERRAQLLRSQAALGTAQEHFLSSSAVLQEQIAREYREEARTLRQQLRERELSGEQERLLRAKATEDCAALARDNAALRAQTLELSRCLELERSLRDEGASRLSSSASRLLSLQESERSGHGENLRLRQLLEDERKRALDALQQVHRLEQELSRKELSVAAARSRATELEARHASAHEASIQLRNDKALLVEHIGDLQNKLAGREKVLRQERVRSLGLDYELEATRASLDRSGTVRRGRLGASSSPTRRSVALSS